MTGPSKPRPPLDMERIDAVMATMPARFENKDFREPMGMFPFEASETLGRLMQLGRVHHPADNAKHWAVTSRPTGDRP